MLVKRVSSPQKPLRPTNPKRKYLTSWEWDILHIAPSIEQCRAKRGGHTRSVTKLEGSNITEQISRFLPSLTIKVNWTVSRAKPSDLDSSRFFSSLWLKVFKVTWNLIKNHLCICFYCCLEIPRQFICTKLLKYCFSIQSWNGDFFLNCGSLQSSFQTISTSCESKQGLLSLDSVWIISHLGMTLEIRPTLEGWEA